jgi:hypothetical protein
MPGNDNCVVAPGFIVEALTERIVERTNRGALIVAVHAE